MAAKASRRSRFRTPVPIRSSRSASNFANRVEKAVDVFAGQRRGDEDRSVGKKEKALSRFPNQIGEGCLDATALRLHQIPFVDHDDGGLVRLLHERGDFLVLRGDTHGGVDHEHAEIGSSNGPLGTHDTKDLDGTGMFAARANSGRIDEHETLSAALVGDVDRVASRSGKIAHDRPAIAQDGVDEG